MLGADAVWSSHDCGFLAEILHVGNYSWQPCSKGPWNGSYVWLRPGAAQPFVLYWGHRCGGEGNRCSHWSQSAHLSERIITSCFAFCLYGTWLLRVSVSGFGQGRAAVTHTLRGYRCSGVCWCVWLSGSPTPLIILHTAPAPAPTHPHSPLKGKYVLQKETCKNFNPGRLLADGGPNLFFLESPSLTIKTYTRNSHFSLCQFDFYWNKVLSSTQQSFSKPYHGRSVFIYSLITWLSHKSRRWLAPLSAALWQGEARRGQTCYTTDSKTGPHCWPMEDSKSKILLTLLGEEGDQFLKAVRGSGC